MKNAILKRAVINALATAVYVIVIASFLFYAPKFFGPDRGDSVLVPIVMLLLLVFSAAFTGSLIFGQPVLWYLDGKKEESLSLIIYTLGVFLVITILALLALYFVV